MSKPLKEYDYARLFKKNQTQDNKGLPTVSAINDKKNLTKPKKSNGKSKVKNVDKNKLNRKDSQSTKVNLFTDILTHSDGVNFPKSNNITQEISNIQQKIEKLKNQHEGLVKIEKIMHKCDCNENILEVNPVYFHSELANLKMIVGSLQNGLDAMFNQFVDIKKILTQPLKTSDNFLNQNTENTSSDYQSSQEQSFPNISIDNNYYHSLHCKNDDLKETEYLYRSCSNMITSHIDLFNYYQSLSRVDQQFCKIDSVISFRQLAELKVIIDILQKYSSIVLKEFNTIQNCVNTCASLSDRGTMDKMRGLGSQEVIKNQDELNNVNLLEKEFHARFNDLTKQQDNLIKYYGAVLAENHYAPFTKHAQPLTLREEGVKLKTDVESLKKHLSVVFNQYQNGLHVQSMPEENKIHKIISESKEFNGTTVPADPKCSIENKFQVTGKSNIKQSKIEKSEIKFDCTSSEENSVIKSSNMIKKRNVLILSDSHGRHFSQYLQDELGPNYLVTSVVKPDAVFEDIIKDFHYLAASFSREDYVIVFAGANNLKSKVKFANAFNFESIISFFGHTNVIFPGIPMLFDYPSLNSLVRRVNSGNNRKLMQLAKKHTNVLLIPKFTFFSKDHPKHSQYFNRSGKKRFCKLIAKVILDHTIFNAPRYNLPAPEHRHSISNLSANNVIESMTVTNVPPLGNNTSEKVRSDANGLINIQQENTNEQITNALQKNSIQTQTSIEHFEKHDITENYNYNYFGDTNPQTFLEAQLQPDTTNIQNIKELHIPGLNSIVNENNKINTTSERLPDNNSSEIPPPKKGFFAGIFMKNNHRNMTTIKELLGQGDVPKPRKNFIQENVKRLKEMKLDKPNNLNSHRNTQPITGRRKNAGTMVSSSRLGQRNSVGGQLSNQQSPPPLMRNRRLPLTSKPHVSLETRHPIIEVEESPKGFRSQGCQTLNGQQLERLYDEGIVRYPSVRGKETDKEVRVVKEMGLQTDAEPELPLHVIHPPPHSVNAPSEDGGLHWDEEKKTGEKDYVKMNATIPDPRRNKSPDSSVDPTRAPPTYQRGVVPRYLREHKKGIEKEKLNKVKDEECPEGHIQLPDDIKCKHLTTLKQNYADLVSQLNQLPVSTDTLRTRTRKKQIEADLDRIEAAIALFSREKVFVKADS